MSFSRSGVLGPESGFDLGPKTYDLRVSIVGAENFQPAIVHLKHQNDHK
jgi:hypothetical protein